MTLFSDIFDIEIPADTPAAVRFPLKPNVVPQTPVMRFWECSGIDANPVTLLINTVAKKAVLAFKTVFNSESPLW